MSNMTFRFGRFYEYFALAIVGTGLFIFLLQLAALGILVIGAPPAQADNIVAANGPRPNYQYVDAHTRFLQSNVDCVRNPVSLRQTYEDVEVTKVVPGTVFDIPSVALFDYDDSGVRGDGYDIIRDVYTLMYKNNVQTIDVVGHTDERGSEEYNDVLGLARAQSFADVLVRLGFNEKSINVLSAGERDLRVPNARTEEEHELNRYVEVVVTKVADIVTTSTQTVRWNRPPHIFHPVGTDATHCTGTRNFPVIGISTNNRVNSYDGLIFQTPNQP